MFWFENIKKFMDYEICFGSFDFLSDFFLVGREMSNFGNEIKDKIFKQEKQINMKVYFFY